MSRRFALALVTSCITVACAISASAEVDTSPKPGGVYLLKPGIFVAAGTRCQDPPFAAIRRYDRKGISTPHSHACVAHVLAKRRSGYGSIYTVRQSCLDTGTGPGKRFTERMTIDVPDATTFTEKSARSTTFNYCPIADLPRWLRGAGS